MPDLDLAVSCTVAKHNLAVSSTGANDNMGHRIHRLALAATGFCDDNSTMAHKTPNCSAFATGLL